LADTVPIPAQDTAYNLDALFKDEKDKKDQEDESNTGAHEPSWQELTLQHLDDPVLGNIKVSDTASFAGAFRKGISRGYFPMNVRFAWSKPLDPAEHPDVYPYIALKTTAEGKPRLSGEVVESARQDFEPNSVNPMISVTMSPEGATEWQRMTRFNIGRCIAIVLDGEVLTYPKVQSEIVGGKTQITGIFTVEEAKILAQNLQSGSYPAAIRVVAKVVLAGQ
jgi:SecD/SecF fusion protein